MTTYPLKTPGQLPVAVPTLPGLLVHWQDGGLKTAAVGDVLTLTTKAMVGLGNVDNTSDVNKPVSTAQQAALDNRVRHDAAQGLTATQRAQALANVQTATETKTAAYVVAAGDIGKLLLCSGTWTLALPAAATVGSGFNLRLRNISSGVITIDPNAAELIDGLATLTLLAGQAFQIVCDGTGWRTVGRENRVRIGGGDVASGATAVDFVLPDGFVYFDIEVSNVLPSVDAGLAVRVSTDGGTTFLAGASDYFHQGLFGLGTTVGANAATDTWAVVAGGHLAADTANPMSGNVRFHQGATGRRAQVQSSFTYVDPGVGNNVVIMHRAGGRVATGRTNAMRFVFGAGATFSSGRFLLYGVAP